MIVTHSGPHTKNLPSHEHHVDDDDDYGSRLVDGDDGQEGKLYYPRGNKRKKMSFLTKYRMIMTKVFLRQRTIPMISSMGFPMTVTEMMGTKKTRKRRMMLLWKPCKNGPRNPTAQHFDPNTAIVKRQ